MRARSIRLRWSWASRKRTCRGTMTAPQPTALQRRWRNCQSVLTDRDPPKHSALSQRCDVDLDAQVDRRLVMARGCI